VPADQDHLLRQFPAGDFAEDIARRGVGQSDGAHLQMNDDFLAAFLHPLHHLRVLHRDGGVGNLGDAVAVLHRPGVRRCQGNWRDGADQAGHRPGPGGFDGAIAADANGVGVVVERLVDQDNLPGRFGGALL